MALRNPSQLLSVAELADLLKIGRSTVRRLAANGTLPALRVGGQWRFDIAEVQKQLDEVCPYTRGFAHLAARVPLVDRERARLVRSDLTRLQLL